MEDEQGTIIVRKSNTKQEQKKLRNEGKSYVSSSGKIVPCRAIRELQPCRNKCRDKISLEQQQDIHRSYWQLGSYQLRQAFVAGLIDIHETKSMRKDKSETKPRNRSNTYKYYLETNGKRVLVCQKCFKSTLSESDQFLKTVVKKRLRDMVPLIMAIFAENTQIQKNWLLLRKQK